MTSAVSETTEIRPGGSEKTLRLTAIGLNPRTSQILNLSPNPFAWEERALRPRLNETI